MTATAVEPDSGPRLGRALVLSAGMREAIGTAVRSFAVAATGEGGDGDDGAPSDGCTECAPALRSTISVAGQTKQKWSSCYENLL